MTPTPPYVPAMTDPCQTPVPIVPTVASDERDVTALMTSVPLVGSVTLVVPVCVNVSGYAPDVVSGPARDIVLDPLLTPVPP